MDNGMDFENKIILTDEDGKEVTFLFLDLIEYQGEEYAVLLPGEPDDDDGEVVILKVAETDNADTEDFISVEDEETLDAVFEIFKERNKDNFNFED